MQVNLYGFMREICVRNSTAQCINQRPVSPQEIYEKLNLQTQKDPILRRKKLYLSLIFIY